VSSSAFLKFSVTTILFLLFLTPTIYVPGLIGIRLEEVYLFLFIIVVFFADKENGWNFKIPLRVVLLLFFLPLLLLSTLSGALLSLPVTLADLTKLIWLLKAIGIYLIFFNYINNEEHSRAFKIDFMLHQFVRFSFISALICFQQYFDLFNLNSLYVPFVAPTQFASLMPGSPTPRVVGMLGNPNVQGFVLSLAIVASIYLYLKDKQKNSIATFFVLFIALLMTLSRGAFVALVVGSFFLFGTYKKNKRFLYIKIIAGSIIFLIFYYAYQVALDNKLLYDAILYRFQLLDNISEDVSFVARYDGWIINWNYFKASPFMGVGLIPRATDIFIGADNEWLHFLRSFGIVGIAWLLLFMFSSFIFKGKRCLENENLSRFILSILLVNITYMVPAAVILSPVTFPFLLVLLSISDRAVFVFKCGSAC
jgi:hypothetical protein